jgi:AraC-like DNA-binding protein
VRRIAPGKPKYARHERLGLETVTYCGPLPYMPTHAHAEHQLTLYAGHPRRFRIAGHRFTGDTRTTVIMQAGEPHASVPLEREETSLRTFYIAEKTMEEAARSLGTVRGTVAFPDPVIADPSTVARLAQVHCALDGGGLADDGPADGGLEGEVAFCAAIEQLVQRHAAFAGAARRLSDSTERVNRARELLADRLADSVGLDELAQAAGMSRFHLIRLFRRQYGVTPFAYQRNLRVDQVRAALRRGVSLADAAAAAGFADQSHLGRVFRAVMGATPGQYRRSFAAAPAR